MDHAPPRRIRLDLAAPVEVAIRNAMGAVESLGCDTRLTKAVNLLSDALTCVADYVDEQIAATARSPAPREEPK